MATLRYWVAVVSMWLSWPKVSTAMVAVDGSPGRVKSSRPDGPF